MGVGCGEAGTSPLLPSPSPAVPFSLPPGLEGAGELWDVETTVVSIEGEACFWRTAVGSTGHRLVLVSRSDTSVRFIYDVRHWPIDHMEQEGTIRGQAFTAAAPPSPSGQPCAAYTILLDLWGSFSPDGDTLHGRERWMHRMADADLIITFEWNGKRR
jgi:hypothetical protein